MSAASSCPAPLLCTSESSMENFEENKLSKLKLLETPTTADFGADDEDVKSTITPRFSPLPRRRSSVSSDEGDLEPPTSVARKVSFADAFGFDLVSVKEFDTWEVPTVSPNHTYETESIQKEEFFLTPSFVLPSVEGILEKMCSKKVLLESVDFIPGTTCMKGIIRVLNVSYEKQIYVRMSLDDWQSYYDLLAEYVPDSCNGNTDQFFFTISLVTPYQKAGAKVEFCICYETAVGTFWDNNEGQNYILICHKKEQILESEKFSEDPADKNKKSCLKLAASKEDEGEDLVETKKLSATEKYIPRIICSHDDSPEDNNDDEDVKSGEEIKDEENDLELFLSQHFVKTRISSCENNYYGEVSEQTTFPNEGQKRTQEEIQTNNSAVFMQQLNAPIIAVLEVEELSAVETSPMMKEEIQALEVGECISSSIAGNHTLEYSKVLPPEHEYEYATENKELIYSDDSTLIEQSTGLQRKSQNDTEHLPGNEAIKRLIINESATSSIENIYNKSTDTTCLGQIDSLLLAQQLDDNANPSSKQNVDIFIGGETETHNKVTSEGTSIEFQTLLSASPSQTEAITSETTLLDIDTSENSNEDNKEKACFTSFQPEKMPMYNQYHTTLDGSNSKYTHDDHQNIKTKLSFPDGNDSELLHTVIHPVLEEQDIQIIESQDDSKERHAICSSDELIGQEYMHQEIFHDDDSTVVEYSPSVSSYDDTSDMSNEQSESPSNKVTLGDKVIIAVITEKKSHSKIETPREDLSKECYGHVSQSENEWLTKNLDRGTGYASQMLDETVEPKEERKEDIELCIDEGIEGDIGETFQRSSPSKLSILCEEDIIHRSAKDVCKEQCDRYFGEVSDYVTLEESQVKCANLDYPHVQSCSSFSMESIVDSNTISKTVSKNIDYIKTVDEKVVEHMDVSETPLANTSSDESVSVGTTNEELSLGPSIFISEPDEQVDIQNSQTEEHCKLGEKYLYDNDEETLSEQAFDNMSTDPLSIRHVSSKVFCFLMFIVFAGLMYHYDFLVCFALYLFSLYWLYWEGDRSRRSVKKQ
ncbi:protein phosphatase 1 regulatory subunit 3A [Pelodytes ibericus]